jgi:hypothetical protein
MQKTGLDTRIDRICETIIANRLGDISALPEEIKKKVFRIYREFIVSYLNVFRQKEGKPRDWFPQSLLIDPDMVDDMRHFFSDHQHVTQAFLTLNKQMDELHGIDRDSQPLLYQHMIADIATGTRK